MYSDTVERVPLIVDLGCGPGNTAVFLAQNFPNANIIGLDIDPCMVTYAQEHNTFTQNAQGDTVSNRCQFYEQNIDADWDEGWSEDLKELLTGKVDAIFSNYALHWVDNFRQLAYNVAQLLRPNGRSVFVGNLLYCGDIISMSESDDERQQLLSVVYYPNEQQYVSDFIFAFRNAHFGRFVADYSEMFSFFPEGYYKNSK